MIFEDNSVSKEALQEDFNAQYWEGRYTLRDSHVPKLLTSLASKALIAGKYLNVVRGCVGELEKDRGGPAVGRRDKNLGMPDNQKNRKRVVLVSGSDDVTKGVEKGEISHSPEDGGILVITLPQERALKFDLEGSGRSSMAKAIEDAYQFSSRALLRWVI